MSSDGWPSGTVTFLFTDVEGSTQRWRADEAAMAEAMRSHDEALNTAIQGAGGVLFKHTGDGVIAAFSSPRAGLVAALEAQRVVGLPVRMGLHTGEAELRDGDYFGTTLNRAARVMDAGHAGQVLVSAASASLLDGAVELVDLGLFELKGLEAAERVFQVGDGSFPELRARRAEVGNIPRELTGFVGRAAELEQVGEAVEAAPIVTLFGVGGTGKTRLAVEVARSLAGSFVDGCWLVELGSVAVPEAVPFAVTTGVGMPAPEVDDVTDALVDRLADRQMLIVIDNCEHVVDAAAEVIERIAAACPRVRIVATSREPLMVGGERVVPVGPLPDDDGLALFLDRARAESPALVLDDRQLDAARALCHRIDGLPLAIELAAARVRSMTPVELVAGLDERFRLLVGNRRGRTERHQTMRATLDWSYSLCDPVEQAVFDRLSVFPAEFDGAAAGAVAGGDDMSAFEVQDALARLVDRSLVTSEVSEDGTTRFRMLETMRVYGREHLRDSGQSDAVRERHARHTSMEMDRLTAIALGPDEGTILRRIEGLLADIVLALDWFIEHDQIEPAMHLPPGLLLTRPREVGAMLERIHAASRELDIPDSLRAELELGTFNAATFSLTEEEILAKLELIEPHPDRDLLGTVPEHRITGSELAAVIFRFPRHHASGRPLSRYMMLMVSCRRLIFSGYRDEALELLDELEQLANETRSLAMSTAVLELRGQIARMDGDYHHAAALLDDFVRQRSGYLALGSMSLLAQFHAISNHVHAGEPVPAADVRRAWEHLERSGATNPTWRAATATAIWLTAQDQRELALRFLSWAAQVDDHRILALFADELSRFDLPLAPDGPPEQLGSLLDALDIL